MPGEVTAEIVVDVIVFLQFLQQKFLLSVNVGGNYVAAVYSCMQPYTFLGGFPADEGRTRVPGVQSPGC